MAEATLAHRIERILTKVNAQSEGFIGHLHFRLTEAYDLDKTALYAYAVDAWGKNPAEILHGGMTASLFDTVMGITAHAVSEAVFTPTVQLQVQYLKPVPLQSTLHLQVKITSVTKTLITATAVAWVDDDRDILVATASATFHQGF